MKITNLEVYELKIPFSIGIKSSSADFLKQDGMDFCVIKIETDNGITGWGDAFSFNCRRAVSEVILWDYNVCNKWSRYCFVGHCSQK